MVLVPTTGAQGPASGTVNVRLLRAFISGIVDRPLWVIIGLRLLQELYRWWLSRRQWNIMRMQVCRQTDEVDYEVVQGCLLSLEQMVSMGRVEKRTLFTKPLNQLLAGNRYLVHELRRATQECRENSQNCLVMRFMPEDAKYHVLQACLNECSALFGPNFVNFNALNGDSTNSDRFKSTWYCLTVTTPVREACRPTQAGDSSSQTGSSSGARDRGETCTFTDMSRRMRGTLRVTLVNESDLRRVADGKLRPPSWGFFNDRHGERFRTVLDFAKNFQTQLVRTSDNSRSLGAQNPFTSEKVHNNAKAVESKPDGGLMKRVSSVPNMGVAAALSRSQSNTLLGSSKDGKKESNSPLRRNSFKTSDTERWDLQSSAPETGVLSENSCFLRLHVPHFLGYKEVSSKPAGGSSSADPRDTVVLQAPLGARDASSSGLTLGARDASSSGLVKRLR